MTAGTHLHAVPDLPGVPIAVEVVPAAQFATWVASKGGHMPGAGPAAPNSTAASPVSEANAAAPAAAPPAVAPEPGGNAAASAPVNVANRATFSRIFQRDMASPQALARRREIVIDTILRYVKQAP